ncbi:hypothetical protein V8E54_009647 [Elaphomyces granulatus]
MAFPPNSEHGTEMTGKEKECLKPLSLTDPADDKNAAILGSSSRLRLVIAIDYGTTYTGIAFATPIGNIAYLNEIDMINISGDEMSFDERIPSVISYSPASEMQERQWGSSLSSNAVAIVDTKLELELQDSSGELDLILKALDGMHNLNFQYIRDYQGLPPYPYKRPEEIVGDFLAKVFDAFLEGMTTRLDQGFPQELRDQLSVDIVVPIPAGWSYRAKNSIFRALTRAGFNQNTFPNLIDMLLVSEPEAAAIYTARYLKELDGADFLKKGECFMVCDAGRGTVVCEDFSDVNASCFNCIFKDVVSYRVMQLQPFELEAVTLATGSKCGSIFVDLAFKKWLRGVLGDKYYQRLDPSQLDSKIGSHHVEGQRMRELMQGFDKHKRKFNRDHRGIKMDLPYPLHNLNKDNKVVGGEITITNEDMRSFFDPCVNQIIELIQGQINQINMQLTRVKNILLVGGFSNSEYLQQEIEFSLGLRHIQLRRPDTSWTAVVRGAVIFGIEKPVLPTMSACSRSYGVSVSESFSETRHDIQDRIVDPITEAPMAKEQLLWLIKKGDLILSNKPKVHVVTEIFNKTFSKTEPRTGTIPIYSYDDHYPPETIYEPEYEHGLAVVCILEYDLTNIPLRDFRRIASRGNNMPFYATFLELTLKFDLQLLNIELSCKGMLLCSETISLAENSELSGYNRAGW